MSIPDSQDTQQKLNEGDQKLLDDLKNHICANNKERVEELLNQLEREVKTGLLNKHGDGQSLLHQAAILHGDVDLMERLGSLCPDLLTEVRTGVYEGQNILHILVSKQNVEGVRAILAHPCLKKFQKFRLLRGKAVGTIFNGTVMMGQLPLSVAALTFNLDMVDELLKAKAKMHAVNTHGDTVLHSLVIFACLHKRKEEEVASMLTQIHERLKKHQQVPPHQSVWQIENNNGLTVLKLTADLGLPLLFKQIVHLEGVYSHLDSHDGLLDSLKYDVTEIDPVARRQWLKAKIPPSEPSSAKVMPLTSEDDLDSPHCASGKDACSSRYTMGPPKKKEPRKKALSVLEIICQKRAADQAVKILNINVIFDIVKTKWKAYIKWHVIWFVSHLLFMAASSSYAVYKAKLIKEAANSSSITTSQDDKNIVIVGSVGAMLAGLILLGLEVCRLFQEKRFNKGLFYHNALYRTMLIVMALALIADSLWYWISEPVNNYFLTLALLFGAWFCTFFIRPCKKFSFFSIMILEVLRGDLIRFLFIIVLDLFAFSMAMYIAFHATPNDSADKFDTPWKTMLTLFKLGLGLEDVDVLAGAGDPWLTTILYILFVVLTYLLILNALIAMMSSTCSLVAQNQQQCWRLEMTSVILMLESMVFDKWLINSGQRITVSTYDMEKRRQVMEDRYFKKISTVKSLYTDSATAISRQNSIKQAVSSDKPKAPLPLKSNAERDLLASFVSQHNTLAGLVTKRDRDSREPDNKRNKSPKLGDTKGPPEMPPPDVDVIIPPHS